MCVYVCVHVYVCVCVHVCVCVVELNYTCCHCSGAYDTHISRLKIGLLVYHWEAGYPLYLGFVYKHVFA